MTIFVVDNYCDQIKERDAVKVAKAHVEECRLGRNPESTFPTREAAGRFIIQRAESQIVAAENRLRMAKRQLAKCRKKFLPETMN